MQMLLWKRVRVSDARILRNTIFVFPESLTTVAPAAPPAAAAEEEEEEEQEVEEEDDIPDLTSFTVDDMKP